MKSKLYSFIFLFFSFFLSFIFIQRVHADTFSLSGTVKDSTGTSISGATINIDTVNTTSVVASNTSDSSGQYSINVPSGTYDIYVNPPSGSTFSPIVVQNKSITSTTVINFIFAPAGFVTLSGVVQNAYGNSLASQEVDLIDPNTGTTKRVVSNSSGAYSAQVTPGTYTLQVSASTNSLSLNAPQTYVLKSANFSLTTSQILNIVMPTKKVTVHVQDQSSNPVSGIKITVDDGDGTNLPFGGSITNGTGYAHYGIVAANPVTDASGNAIVYLFPNDVNTSYTLTATPPNGTPYAQTTLSNFNITNDATVTINMIPAITLSGKVQDAYGNGISGQEVDLISNDTGVTKTVVSNSSGAYSAQVAPGAYTLQISASTNSLSLNAPQTYVLKSTNLSLTNSQVLNIVMPTKKVTVHVQDPAGNPISGIKLTADGGDGTNLPVGGSITNGTGYSHYGLLAQGPSTDSSGNANLYLFPNNSSTPYTFTATPPNGTSYATTTLSNVNIANDTTVTINMIQSVTLSGLVQDAYGSPLASQEVDLIDPNTGITKTILSNSSGAYSAQVTAGTYTLQVSASTNSLSLNAPQTYVLKSTNFSLTSNQVLNIVMPTKKVTVHVQDQSSNPVSGVQIQINGGDGINLPIGGGITNGTGNSHYGTVASAPITDMSGNAIVYLFPNNVNTPYTFIATPQSGTPYNQFTLTNISVMADQTELISLQYNHASPVTTSNLMTQNIDGTYSNPTTVTLSATAASGYTVANKFYKVDGGTQQTYNAPFTVLGQGSHTVEYWSVDNSGVQETHNTKTFTIHVNQPPFVNPLNGGLINAGGTYTETGSFTDSDSSSWTATVDYGDGAGPVTLPLNADKTFNLSHKYTTAGTYTVVVVVTDDQMATGTTTATVSVNGAPHVNTLTGGTISSGDTYTENGSFTDSDSSSWTATVNYGDGSGAQPLTLTNKTFALSHSYTTPGSYTVTVSVTDNQGLTGSTTGTVVVNNRPPFINPLHGALINTGDTYTESGSFTDSDSTLWTATVDYGDGVGPVSLPLNADKTFSLSHKYTAAGSYSVVVVVTDNQGGTGTTTTTVAVNEPPHVAALINANILKGDTFTQSGSFTDTDSSSWTAVVDYGDGSGIQPLTLSGQNFSLSHIYTSAGNFTVTVTITDNQGAKGSASVTVTVDGPPQINALSGASINKGDTYTENGSFVDADSSSWTATVNYGDGGLDQPLSLTVKTFLLSHAYTNSGIYSVIVKITDNQGAVGTQTASVTVNEPPHINALNGATINSGDTYTENGSFVDNDSTSWTGTVNYGDGSSTSPLSISNKTFALNHIYPIPGTYTVTVSVTDNQGATSTQTTTVTVRDRSPFVNPLNGIAINTNDTYSETGSFTDSDSTSWSATVDYGDGVGPVSLSLNPDKTFDLSHQYTTAGIYTVAVVVTDNQGATGTTITTVTVNEPPHVKPLTDATIIKGATFTQNGSFTDDDSTSWTATVDYGDGAGAQNLPLSGKNFTLNHTYTTAGIYTVTVKVKDNQGAFGTATGTVTVDAPPAIQTLIGGSINKGQTYTENGSFTDSDSTSWTSTVNYGDGSGTNSLTLNPDKTFALSHQYTTSGTYTVTVTVTDNQGAVGSQAATVTVNEPPHVNTLSGGTINSGDTYTESGSFVDIDSTSWTATVDYGDGSGVQPLSLSGKTFSLSHMYSTPGSYTVTVNVTDNQGTTGTASATVVVNNRPPFVNPLNGGSINAGGTYSENGSFIDTDSTSWTGTIDYGDGAGPVNLSLNSDKTFTLSHKYTTAGVYIATVVVTDNQGATGTTLATVTVNGAPQIATLSGAQINKGQTYNENGSFTDPDSSSWTATVDYGDGSGTQNLTLSGKNFSLSHVYATAGVFTTTVKVTDNQGAVGTQTATITVNTPPVVSDLAVVSLNQGQTYQDSGSFTDSDSTSWTGTVNYGDGSGVQSLPLSGQNFSLSHLYSSAGNYTVTVTVTDNQGATGTTSTTVHVNAPPVIAALSNATIIQNGTFSQNGSFTDADSSSWSGTVNYGDGSGTNSLTLNADKTFALTHTYTTAGQFTATVVITDNQGATDTKTATITVDAPAQIATLTGAHINLGQAYTENGSFTDSDSTSWSGTVDYGDGSGAQILPLNADNTFSLNYTYTTAGSHTVTVQIHDNQGAVATATTTVVVNAPPAIQTIPNQTINEGASYSAISSFTDTDSTSWTGTVNYGDGSGTNALTLNPDKTFALNHTYKDNGSYTITVTITDNQGAGSTKTGVVTVNNVAPTVSTLTVSPSPTHINTTTNANATFTDPGVLDTHSATINWGDGTTTNGTVTETNGSGSVSGTHTYTTFGTYTVTVTVTDKDNGSGQKTASETVVKQITSLDPATVYISKGLLDILNTFNVKADVYKDSTLVTTGTLTGINPSATGNGTAETITFPTFTALDFPSGSTLKITVSACSASGLGTGTATLHYNASAVDSKFGVTIGTTDTIYHLLANAILGATAGTTAQTVNAQSTCTTGYTSFGTWTVTP